MYAIAHSGFYPVYFKGKVKMALQGLPKFVEPKIQYGTILVLIAQVIFAGAFLLSISSGQQEIKSNFISSQQEAKINDSKTQDKLQTLLIALPLINRDIEISAKRISTLEDTERELNERLDKIDLLQATEHQDLEALKERYNELVAASQALIVRPHR